MNAVTMSEFFAEVAPIDHAIEDCTDQTDGTSRDSYTERATGREIGFVKFSEGREPTYHLWSAGV